MEGSSQKLHSKLRLWEYPDKYVFEPVDGVTDAILQINRADGSMETIGEMPQHTQNAKVKTVYGVVGMIRLLVGSYVLVIQERENVGTYLGHPIFKISSLQLLPCDNSLNTSSSEQKKMETEFAALLKASQKVSGLYISYEVNITLCSQRLHGLGDESKSLPLWRQAEQRFVWNNYLMEPLIENKLDQYLIPVIQGYFETFSANIGSKSVNVTIIARRCTRRTEIKKRSFQQQHLTKEEIIIQLVGPSSQNRLLLKRTEWRKPEPFLLLTPDI